MEFMSFVYEICVSSWIGVRSLSCTWYVDAEASYQLDILRIGDAYNVINVDAAMVHFYYGDSLICKLQHAPVKCSESWIMELFCQLPSYHIVQNTNLSSLLLNNTSDHSKYQDNSLRLSPLSLFLQMSKNDRAFLD